MMMKTTTKKVLTGLATGLFSLLSQAQCPTGMSLTVNSNYQTGDVSISQVYMGGTPSASVSNYYYIYDTNYNNYNYTSSIGANGVGNFYNLPSGTYSVCAYSNDSIANPGCSFVNECTVFTTSNTANPNNCQAYFTYYTDTNSCVTYFNNASTCTYSTSTWVIDGVPFSTTGTTYSVALSQGHHNISLLNSFIGSGIDSTWNWVYVSCGTGTVNPPTCGASFYQYTDSNCVTHFINNSTGTNLSSQWNINGNTYNTQDVHLLLPDNNYFVQLFNLSNGNFCDSIGQYVTVACANNSVFPTNCNASFYSYTDSNCVSHFINTSTGNILYNYWNINGVNYYSNDVHISLNNGSTFVATLSNYNNTSSITPCSSLTQSMIVSCQTSTVAPNTCYSSANLQIFGDSTNPGNYFAYNMSYGSGNLSYLWDFGDGTTSTQEYPFHQYAVPGQYIVCLTVTANNGTTTCTDTQCDSSSVHRIAAGFFMSQLNVINPAIATGVAQKSVINSFSTYPNPLQDELTMILELSKTNQNLSYSLVDALGKIVSKQSINDSKTMINTSNLPQGFYFLSITDQQGNVIKTAKLVK